MYTRYQYMWTAYAAKHDIKDEYNDVMLVSFVASIKNGYAANTLWVIYSRINVSFIDRFGLNLKGLPRLKNTTIKRLMTFNAEEIHAVLLTLQDKKDDSYAILYGVCNV